MRMGWRIVAIALVFGTTSIAWLVLGGVMIGRTEGQAGKLSGQVAELWGHEQQQVAPALNFHWTTIEERSSTETTNGKVRVVRTKHTHHHNKDVPFASTDIDVDLSLDQRLKGLMWYSLYDVDFAANWSYVHSEAETGELQISFRFPDPDGLYDGFHFVVNGEDRASRLQLVDGNLTTEIPVAPGDRVELAIGYGSRGMDAWRYLPSAGVTSLDAFELTMKTDFGSIDFPPYTMSPSQKQRTDRGWTLDWTFERVVTGQGIGMVMPSRIQPGELASQLSFSAPISLLFFFLLLFVLSVLRGIDIHPVNYLFLGGAFFAFHLLFGYSVDHITLIPAFIVSSIVSIVLLVSYLRLVVSARFAFVEAAAAQLIYLVGFSLAHFWDGFTGLTVTIMSILTLFVLMQLTGRVKWSEVLARKPAPPAPPAPPAVQPQPEPQGA